MIVLFKGAHRGVQMLNIQTVSCPCGIVFFSFWTVDLGSYFDMKMIFAPRRLVATALDNMLISLWLSTVYVCLIPVSTWGGGVADLGWLPPWTGVAFLTKSCVSYPLSSARMCTFSECSALWVSWVKRWTCLLTSFPAHVHTHTHTGHCWLHLDVIDSWHSNIWIHWLTHHGFLNAVTLFQTCFHWSETWWYTLTWNDEIMSGNTARLLSLFKLHSFIIEKYTSYLHFQQSGVITIIYHATLKSNLNTKSKVKMCKAWKKSFPHIQCKNM